MPLFTKNAGREPFEARFRAKGGSVEEIFFPHAGSSVHSPIECGLKSGRKKIGRCYGLVFTEIRTNSALKGWESTSKSRKNKHFFWFGRNKFHRSTIEKLAAVDQKSHTIYWRHSYEMGVSKIFAWGQIQLLLGFRYAQMCPIAEILEISDSYGFLQ